jgi:hypothetical protein
VNQVEVRENLRKVICRFEKSASSRLAENTACGSGAGMVESDRSGMKAIRHENKIEFFGKLSA